MWGLLTAPLWRTLSRRVLGALWCGPVTSSSYVTTCHKGSFDTVPCHGDRAALCHKGLLHTLPPALGLPPAHPKWPRGEEIPHPKCLRQPDRIFSNSSNHQQPALQAQGSRWSRQGCQRSRSGKGTGLCTEAGTASLGHILAGAILNPRLGHRQGTCGPWHKCCFDSCG